MTAPTARDRARRIRKLSPQPLVLAWQKPIEQEILAAERAAAERMRERCALAVGAMLGSDPWPRSIEEAERLIRALEVDDAE